MRILVGVCALSRWTSNTQPVGLRQHHLQDRHEGRRLAEVAVAHDVCVDVEPVGVAAALDAAGHVVKTTDNSWRQCLFSQLVIEILKPLMSIIQLPLGLRV